MPDVTLLMLHGWGFDRSVWEPLAAELRDVPVETADLGYFGHPESASVATPVVAVGHSLGSLLLLRDPPRGCIGMVAINGFDCFAEQPGWPGVPRRAVQRMIDRFAAAPAEVLTEFRRRCGDGEAAAGADPALLAEHLALLRDSDERARAGDRPVLSLQAIDDPILPPPLREQAFAGARRIDSEG